jgi:hypothetical protein
MNTPVTAVWAKAAVMTVDIERRVLESFIVLFPASSTAQDSIEWGFKMQI